jgi:hypothetical protein
MTGSNISDLRKSFPILFGSRWRVRGLDEALASIDPDALCAEYTALRQAAPRRSLAGKTYFVGHTGVASAAGHSNRLEEHCAIALVNLGRRWPRPEGNWFRILDYQVPLKARQTDARIGKVDLLGVTELGRLMIIELKVMSHSGGRSDAPPAALMEGLRYAAIVEADLEAIASEAERRFGVRIAKEPPIVQLLAPEGWWRSWLDLLPAGDWGGAFARLAKAVEAQTGVAIECRALEDVEIAYGLDGRAPRLDHVPALYPVRPGEEPPIGDALSSASSADSEGMTNYLETTYRALWAWAERHHGGELDGGRRQGRPPVLKPEFASRNVLAPPDGSQADKIRAAIGSAQRHKHFASLRSSQALAQSVFGAISAFERLGVFEAVTAECGRPAFFQTHRGWTVALEHEVDTLGEPRPTSIDVLLSGPDRRVAIECKFTEAEFGTCSRPRLRPGDAAYSKQRCDGNYRSQAGRSGRCALTTIGVRYWDHLPRLFAWSADRDHEPCPFGAAYQLARNALAAVVSPDGEVDPARGHALVLYDARNPAFQADGEADRQWEATIAACLVPGLLRRLSWQRLLTFIATVPDLEWLVDSLRDKYALLPE